MKRSNFGLDGEAALSILDGYDVHGQFLPYVSLAFFAVHAPETQTLALTMANTVVGRNALNPDFAVVAS